MGLFHELVSLFAKRRPFEDVLEQLERMLLLTRQMVESANSVYWGNAEPEEARVQIYEQDIEVNRFERRIRRLLAAYAVAGSEADGTHALRVMSLVKDVERLGDYAKNLAELRAYCSVLPEDSTVEELRDLSKAVERLMDAGIAAIVKSDVEAARQLTPTGRGLCKRCDDLVARCAASDYDAGTAVCVSLAARYYKRIAAHLLNVLSSLIMPLHKLDYYDEEALEAR